MKAVPPSANKIAIVGTVGIPANYGGFETLADNLVRANEQLAAPHLMTVYCSGRHYRGRPTNYHAALLKYVPLPANGPLSVIYDIASLLSAMVNRSHVILLLGVSGAIALPLVRLFSNCKVVTNVDGIEWRREKWGKLARWFLRLSERMAVRFSHHVIADNDAIADYLQDAYRLSSTVIAYGGDQAMAAAATPIDDYQLPTDYALSIARIEPENNIHILAEAFSLQPSRHLVVVGNWRGSGYGEMLRERYGCYRNIHLLDPIYDAGKLKTLRQHAGLYIHGHSAGGTNPSLVEAMHCARPIFAYDCTFNRSTTENKALYFRDADELTTLLAATQRPLLDAVARDMLEIARRRYTWDIVARQYFVLLTQKSMVHPRP